MSSTSLEAEKEPLPKWQRVSVEEEANCMQRFFFTWAVPFFRRAAKLGTGLSLVDLNLQPGVEDPDNYLRRLKEVFHILPNGEASNSFRSSILLLIRRNLIYSVSMMNIAVLIGLVSPYLISVIVTVCTPTETPGEFELSLGIGIVCAVGIFLVSSLSLTIAQNGWHIGTRCARGAYVATSALLFEKPSLITSSEMSAFSEGEIVNLMAIDTQTVFQVVMFFNVFAILPALVLGPTIVLITQLEWTVFVAIAVLFVNTFIVDYLSKRVARWQKYKNKLSDKRAIRMNETLQGIRTVKLNAWEEYIRKRIMEFRSKEVIELRNMSVLRAFQYFLSFCVPTITMVGTFVLYESAVEGAVLDNAKIFFCIPLFLQLSMGLFFIPNMINEYRRYVVSADRLERFLLLKNDYVERKISNTDGTVVIKNAELTWASSQNGNEKPKKNAKAVETVEEPQKEEKSTLRNLNLTVANGELIAIVGKVASGKTTLISGILNLLKLPTGSIDVNGTTGFVAQSAFIMNDTIRENICFGEPFDRERYNKIIEACAFTRDLATFRSGDMMEVGEKGITISGGQKQRIALCRAAYVDRQIIIFDDCLSAMDAHVGETCFSECMQDLLKDKTRIFVTNQLNFAQRCDRIVILKDETIHDVGTYEEVSERNSALFSSLTEEVPAAEEPTNIEAIAAAALTPTETDDAAETEAKKEEEGDADDKDKDIIMKKEGKVAGRIGMKDFFQLGREARTTWLLIILAVFMLAVPTLQFLVSFYISEWANAINAEVAEGEPAPGIYNPQLVTLIVVTVLFSISAALLSLTLNGFFLLSAKRVHDQMLLTIFKNPMSWYDTTPVGRILQRFSGDIMNLDLVLPRMLEMWSDNLGQVLTAIIPSAIVLPPFLIIVLPLLFLFYRAYKYYGLVILETQRFAMVAMGPILGSFQAYLQGLPSIRAFNKVSYFIDLFRKNNATFTRTMYCQFSVDRVFLVFLGATVVSGFVAFLALMLVVLRDTAFITPQLAGLVLTYSISLNFRFFGLFYSTAQIERLMASSQRCLEYLHMDSEPDVSKEDASVDEKAIDVWPSSGKIVFEGVKMRYRDDLPIVLKGVNFTINNGEKAALVGRSGCGKSSIVLTVFRMVELSEGNIYIGDVNIQSIPLKQLRRKIGMIPQDSWLFAGTIRLNLDVGAERTDEEIWEALRLVNLYETVQNLENGLDHEVEEKGDNLSGGTVQLLCLARVLLKKPKIIVMDEATSSVDLHTDEIVQRTIRTSFKDSTLLTIAHRLQTIIDFNKIVVIDKGQVVECGTPNSLLTDNPNGFFSNLVDATGESSAQSLRTRAAEAEAEQSGISNTVKDS